MKLRTKFSLVLLAALFGACSEKTKTQRVVEYQADPKQAEEIENLKKQNESLKSESESSVGLVKSEADKTAKQSAEEKKSLEAKIAEISGENSKLSDRLKAAMDRGDEDVVSLLKALQTHSDVPHRDQLVTDVANSKKAVEDSTTVVDANTKVVEDASLKNEEASSALKVASEDYDSVKSTLDADKVKETELKSSIESLTNSKTETETLITGKKTDLTASEEKAGLLTGRINTNKESVVAWTQDIAVISADIAKETDRKKLEELTNTLTTKQDALKKTQEVTIPSDEAELTAVNVQTEEIKAVIKENEDKLAGTIAELDKANGELVAVSESIKAAEGDEGTLAKAEKAKADAQTVASEASVGLSTSTMSLIDSQSTKTKASESLALAEKNLATYDSYIIEEVAIEPVPEVIPAPAGEEAPAPAAEEVPAPAAEEAPAPAAEEAPAPAAEETPAPTEAAPTAEETPAPATEATAS